MDAMKNMLDKIWNFLLTIAEERAKFVAQKAKYRGY